MAHTGLSSDVWRDGIATRGKELQLFGRRDMGYMQACTIFLGQFHRLTRWCQTGLLAANQRMKWHLRIVSPSLLDLSHIPIDDVRILTMCHQWQLAGLEDAFQRLLLVNQHITRRWPHKQLDAWNPVCRQLGKGFRIIVGGPIEERVVYVALLTGQSKLLFQSLQRSRLWIAVGHIKKRSNTTGSSSPTFCIDISLLRQSRLTKMHMVVNDTWQDITTRGIDDGVKQRSSDWCVFWSLRYKDNITVFNGDVALDDTAFIDNISPFD